LSAGGCNACEADVDVLSTIVFDLGRFGIQFVASPRHADGLLITGPVTENMRLALDRGNEAGERG
jgi:Ni,Fe-hydrogenase III small subunit